MLTNEQVGRSKLNINQESSANPFGSIDRRALKISTAPFAGNDGRRTQNIKRKLEEFVLVSNMYDSKVDYKTFAKGLLKKKEKSGLGLVDPHDTLVNKAVKFQKDISNSSQLKIPRNGALLKQSCKG